MNKRVISMTNFESIILDRIQMASSQSALGDEFV